MSLDPFLIIGAARSGTTAMSIYLSRHSLVEFTNPKETHFLSFAGQKVAFTGPGDNETINRVAITDELCWQRLYSASTGHTIGEGSVSTLYYHRNAIANIQRYCPNVRMVVMLRQPVDRAISAYSYLRSRGYETLTLMDALKAESSRIGAGYHHLWHYTSMSRYAESIAAFIAAFGRDRLLILDYESFADDPSAAVTQVQKFLGLPHEQMQLDPDLRINASGTRYAPVRYVEASLRRNSHTRRILKAMIPLLVRERLRQVTSRPLVVDNVARDYLRSCLSDEIGQLRGLLGADTPAWAHK